MEMGQIELGFEPDQSSLRTFFLDGLEGREEGGVPFEGREAGEGGEGSVH